MAAPLSPLFAFALCRLQPSGCAESKQGEASAAALQKSFTPQATPMRKRIHDGLGIHRHTRHG